MKAKRGKAKGGGENAWFAYSLPHKEIYGIMTNGACQNQTVCRENGGRAAIDHIGEGFEFMPLQTEYNKDTIKESILNKLLRYYGCTIEDATPKQVYAAVAEHRARPDHAQVAL